MPSVYSQGEASDASHQKVGRVPKPFYGLIYASGNDGYDRVRICRSRSGDDAVADLGVGEWSDWWLDTFEIEGSEVEGYVQMKLVTLTPTADAFELFVPQIWPREGVQRFLTQLPKRLIQKSVRFFKIRLATRLGRWMTTPILNS